jgi:Ulp1 family protease
MQINHTLEFHYVRQPSPQQANVSDCGVHVLYNTRVLIQRLMVPMYRPERPWDLSDIDPDTSGNRAALRSLFQQKLVERLDRESP